MRLLCFGVRFTQLIAPAPFSAAALIYAPVLFRQSLTADVWTVFPLCTAVHYLSVRQPDYNSVPRIFRHFQDN